MSIRTVVVAAIVTVTCSTAHASLVQFELLPTGPLVVQPGQEVGFTVIEDYDLYSYYSHVPGNPEPGPIFIGGQSWFNGSGYRVQESVYLLDFSAWSSDGQHRAASLGGPDNIWSFSMSFASPGQYTVSAGGGWRGWWNTWSWDSYSTRDCFFFICGPWDSHHWQESHSTPISGGFPARQLQVTVVPEPATAALLLSGLVVLEWAARCRRRGGTAAENP
jgi:hypothetical protein